MGENIPMSSADTSSSRCGRPVRGATLERAEMTRFMRWAGERHGAPFRGLCGAVAVVGRRARGVLGRHLGVLRRARLQALRAGARRAGSHEMPGTVWFEERRAELRREPAAGPGVHDPPISENLSPCFTPPSCAELREITWGELTSSPAVCSSPRRRGGLRSLGVGRGDRVVAYMPNILETLIAFLAVGERRRGVVERRARVRGAQRDRPLRPDRAEGPARRRRLPPRRQGLRPMALVVEEILAELPSVEHVVVLPYLSTTRERAAARKRSRRADRAAEKLGRAARSPGIGWDSRPPETELRAGALRPPPVGALLLRHDRPAEGDRAGPRRHPDRAAEEAPAPRPAPRRPHVLVHHDRLDDVELPRRLPAQPMPRSCSTTAARRTPTWGCCGSWPSAPESPAWASALACSGSCEKGDIAARPRLRPQRPARDRLDRLAAGAPESFRWVYEARRPRTSGCSRPAAAPMSARPSSRAARCCRSMRANCSAARSAARWSPGTSRETACTSTRSASW